MKNKLLPILLSTAIIGICISVVLETKTVNAKASAAHESSTGAPGEGTCAITACHGNGFALSEEEFGKVSELEIQGLSGSYEIGKTYNITLRAIRSGLKRAGFQITALDPTYNNCGMLNPLPNSTTVQLQKNSIFGFERRYMTHKIGGIKPLKKDTIEWKFTWQAPPLDVGKITFYYAINIANFDNTNKGDTIVTHSFSINSPTSGVYVWEGVNAHTLYSMPNPANDFVTFGTIGNNAEQFVSAMIFNNCGELVKECSQESHSLIPLRIDVSDLQQGIYSVRTRTNDKKEYKTTFIKQ